MMRWSAAALTFVLVACSGAQELAPTTSTTSSVATTTTVPPTTTTVSPTTTTVSPTTTTTLAPLQGLVYEEIARIGFPIQLVPIPGGDHSLLATKDGRVWSFDGTSIGPDPLLDIRGQVRNQGEQGLLSIAVHPVGTSRFFAHYSASDGDTVVSEFLIADDGIAPRTERVLLRLDQPAGNHNGGMIQFGPDGALYVGLGDGGGANDRFGHGQNRESLLGGLVRIDVDGLAEPELYQYGLRNPWRFWIDGEDIYIADVGQNAFEEISFARLEEGVNYGWPITEGLHCFRPSTDCDTTGVTLPIVEIPHGDDGTRSITGGVVYRGLAIPELNGTFFFSDWGGGYLRGLRDGEVTDYTDQVGKAGNVASFGVDARGEMYVLTSERVLKLVPVR